jgi:hypothetical protein
LYQNDKPKPFFKENRMPFGSKENNYIDFDYEGLISKELSQEGPSLAVADNRGWEGRYFYRWNQRQSRKKIYLNKE